MLFHGWLDGRSLFAIFLQPIGPFQRTCPSNQSREAGMRQALPMILIRVMVGLVFLFEGALKFVLPGDFGAASFVAIGMPFPHLLAPTVGCIEILCGIAVLLNLFAGDAALLLMLMILTALAAKLPILLGRHWGPFPLPAMHHYGWLSFLHESRAELCMIFVLIAILIDSGLKVGRRRRWYQGK
jgi:uncharacterized membrane protein YphA (DoxX/SURF4 family)